jgi:TonB family protein
MSKNKILPILILFFCFIFNSYSQDGKESEVIFQDGTKKTERTFKYPGGKDSFYTDIVDNFKIPKQAKKDNLTGKIILKITIDTLGVAKGEIVTGLRSDVDDAALEMTRRLKKSQPANQGGRNVTTTFIIPLKI